MASDEAADVDIRDMNTSTLPSLSQYGSKELKELFLKLDKGDNQGAEGQINWHSSSNVPNTVNLEQLADVATNDAHSDDPWLEIVEQPKSKGIRFRYKCEGRSAGSIPGANSTTEHKTFPSVKINNLKDHAAIVVVSCVTNDEPHRPHPHTLVGKECRKGVCTVKLKRSNVATFPNLGIQCVTKKEIKESLKEREQIRVDPFGTGYNYDSAKLQLNIVRLCFQAFLPDEDGKYTRIIQPVVSNPIFDKKAVNDLVICRLSKQSGVAKGGDEVFLLCEKVNKDDIQVRFYEESNDDIVWEKSGDFSPTDVHRQFAIVFKTPPYKNQSITRPVEVNLQLYRPSDEGTSEPKKFLYTPNDSDAENIQRKRKKRNLPSTNIGTNNMNTPAFNLLTDGIKEDPELPRNINLRERIKAKATRSQGKPSTLYTANPELNHIDGTSILLVHNEDLQEEVLLQNSFSQITTTASELAEVRAQEDNTADHMYVVTAAAAAEENSSDKEDIMLSDLPIGQTLNDTGRLDSGSLPSLPTLPSMDVDSDLINSVARDIKIQSDSTGEIKHVSRMITRGKKIKK